MHALKIYHSVSQIGEGWTIGDISKLKGLGSNAIAGYVYDHYEKEAKLLEKVEALKSEYIVHASL